MLSTGGSAYEQERSIFWLKYIDQIEEIKIGVTEHTDYVLRNRFAKLPGDTRMYMAFYKNCKIRIYRDNDPAALLMKLDKVLAIEFTENGNAAYLYKKDHDFAKKMFNRYQVASVSDFKFQIPEYGFIDRIIHRGYWQSGADWTLRRG